jgi:hypothetical protein
MEKIDKSKLKTTLRLQKVKENDQEMIEKLFPANLSLLRQQNFFEITKKVNQPLNKLAFLL